MPFGMASGVSRGMCVLDDISVRTIYRWSLEHNNKVFVCYVDYEKAFDRVNWEIAG